MTVITPETAIHDAPLFQRAISAEITRNVQMSKLTSIEVDVKAKLKVDYETAETCLRLLNAFLEDNPGSMLNETVTPVDCSSVPIRKYHIAIAF